uniref:Tumor necrosis factor ligand superfamily member 14-like n=1 Tax=Gouania willdenowi TaxID=441366 RepID=A0A8C5DBI4_GOUWI
MEDTVVTIPPVFVVDSRANYLTMHKEKKQSWKRAKHKFLMVLVGLALLGLLVEGYFIYRLEQKTKQMPTVQTFQRPFAHLLGSHLPVGEDNVMQWVKEGEAITQHMAYDRGRLLVEVEGYYYLYSKVQLNAADECLLIQHKIMKNTTAYGQPIELMKSKSFRCWTQENQKEMFSQVQDLWNNFLGGIFHLQRGDRIYVTLESKENAPLNPGPTENFMGAFMVFP